MNSAEEIPLGIEFAAGSTVNTKPAPRERA
jgi:hypothetical protein